MNKQQKETSLANLSVDALSKGYASGEFSPVDATKACLARIDMFNDQVNAFCFVDAENAVTRAQESEKRWRAGAPLSSIDGVPASSKDTTMVIGWTSTVGSHILGSGKPATIDSSPVARLKEAGAVLLGLTTSPEIGWKGVTDSPRQGITRNPWNITKTPGGSSGGAAVAAALGMGCLHIGTDAGGSVRIPAAFTGVFGHKPSYGRVPNYPPSAFSSISHAGPITRTVKDAAHMMNVLTGRDPRDWTALPSNNTDYTNGVSYDITGVKIAYCPNMGGLKPEPDVAQRIKEAAQILSDLGALVVDVDFDLTDVKEMFEIIWHGAADWRMKDYSADDLNQLDPGLREFLKRPHDTSSLSLMDAGQLRLEFGVRSNIFFENYDLMITPTLPILAFPTGQNVPNGGTYQDWWNWAAYCYPFNLTGQPACSVPCGFSANGLPVGLQIIGRQFDDAQVMRTAAAFKSALPALMPVAPMGTHHFEHT